MDQEQYQEQWDKKYKAAYDKNNALLRSGTYVKRVSDVLRQAENDTVVSNGDYIIDKVINDNTIELRGHMGAYSSREFILRLWEKAGWSLELYKSSYATRFGEYVSDWVPDEYYGKRKN